jgi:hypothetical protein
MRAITMIVSFGLRQVMEAESAQTIENYFCDGSQLLPNALKVANQRSWQALELALIGKSLQGKLKQWLSSEQIKAFSRQVEDVLTQQGQKFRQACLLDLRRLQSENDWQVSGAEIATLCNSFQRFTDQERLIDKAWQVVKESAKQLDKEGFLALSELLQYRPPNGPPLLIAAFGYFLRYEVASDNQLSQILNFTLLQHISQEQTRGFNALQDAIKILGSEFQQSLQDVSCQLSQVEETVSETHQSVVEIREMLAAVQAQLASLQAGKESEVVQQDLKKQAIEETLQRFEPLPAKQQAKLPDFLLNELDKTPTVCPVVPEESLEKRAVERPKLPDFWLEDSPVSGVQVQEPSKKKAIQAPAFLLNEIGTFVVSVQIEPADSGCQVSGSGSYRFNQQATLISQPQEGWQFSHWSGDISGSHPSVMVTMDRDKSITAHFIKQRSVRLGKAFQA